ncbi:3-oxoacyl-reductase [Fusarium heterosporum]|uniref:3-oxoacyl-reductase n=1 Tax=Fusarium heterosporum TaxID=42747 RepID=A0A8H5WIL9_FUSHE|nr:3-oxoacyl-reductase [Fusarium heterosporum]
MASQELNAGSLFNVDGLVAVVTGGGTGIGLMFVKALLQNGASKIYIAGRRKEKLDEVAQSLGERVVGVQCDVTSKSDLQGVVAQVEKETGYINLLVCNSGIGGPQVKPITPETSLEDWAKSNFDTDFDAYVNTFAINTASVWFTSMAFLGLLKKGNEKGNVDQTSQIIVTSSIAAFNKKAPGGWAYGQSKAGAVSAAKQLAVALPQWNIRANCIAPGLFPSEMSEPIVKLYSDDSGQPGGVPTSMVPLGRMGDEKDMSGTFLYLASRAGGYCNGTVIVVDGGRLNNFPTTN